MFEIRNAKEEDLPRIHQLNESETPKVGEITFQELKRLHNISIYSKVATLDSHIVAFLLGLGIGVDYKSLNYQWFLKNYPSFVYIDRIVVDSNSRGQGIGKGLYQDFEKFARGRAPILTCEVNLRPRNEISLKFHEAFGFKQVGTQDTDGGKKTVSLLVKEIN